MVFQPGFVVPSAASLPAIHQTCVTANGSLSRASQHQAEREASRELPGPPSRGEFFERAPQSSKGLFFVFSDLFPRKIDGSSESSFLSPGLQGETPPLLALRPEEVRSKTLLNLFFDNVHGLRGNRPDAIALSSKANGEWVNICWRDYGRLVCQVANGLRNLGFQSGDHAAILGSNAPQWLIADLAVMCLGGCTAGIYPNDVPEQVAFVCKHFQAKVVFVDCESQYEKLLGMSDELGNVDFVVSWMHDARNVKTMRSKAAPWKLISWDELLSKGKRNLEAAEELIEAQARAIPPTALCMTVYTSGTTGRPKGACYRHRNLYFIAEEISRSVGSGGRDITLSFLPLCHVAERIQGELLAIYDANTVYFAESIAHVKKNLNEVRPTLFLCVPRIWEKFASALKHVFAKEPLVRRLVLQHAVRNGSKIGDCRNSLRGERPAFWTAWQWRIYKEHVIGKILTQLGLNRCHTFASGAAPLNPDISRFFRSLGIDIAELYGQSESTGVIALTPKGAIKPGTAGLPLRGTQVVIGEGGEVLAKGDNVFAGYYNDARATGEAIDDAGFLHTGDVGHFDEDGYLVISDRLKDLIKTSGGKFIAPQPTEARLKSFDGIAQVVIIGDGKPYCTALITLDESSIPELLKEVGVGPDADSNNVLARNKRISAAIQRRIDEVNATLPSYATIKYFRILPSELTVEGGELTPTMKVKRRVVQEKYAQIISEMYLTVDIPKRAESVGANSNSP